MPCMPAQAHGSRSGNTSLRRLVVERDHGICSQQGCRRDCLSLVSRLKSVKDRQVMNDSSYGRRRFIYCYEPPCFSASMLTMGCCYMYCFGREGLQRVRRVVSLAARMRMVFFASIYTFSTACRHVDPTAWRSYT